MYDVGGKTSGPALRWRDHAGNNIKRFLTRGGSDPDDVRMEGSEEGICR